MAENKSSDRFQEVIKDYLTKRAAEDPLFAKTFEKKGKNIIDCTTYILNTVQKSGRQGFADEEVFSMAVHYYDEDIIEVGKSVDATVIINQEIQLTEEQKKEARDKAIQKIQEEAYQSMHAKRNKINKVTNPVVAQTSLFG